MRNLLVAVVLLLTSGGLLSAQNDSVGFNTYKKEFIWEGRANNVIIYTQRITNIGTGKVTEQVLLESGNESGQFPIEELNTVVAAMNWMLTQRDSNANKPELTVTTSTYMQFGMFWSVMGKWSFVIDFDARLSGHAVYIDQATFSQTLVIFERMKAAREL